MALASQGPALTVSLSDEITKEIVKLGFPTIPKLLEHNRPVTLRMMQALGALNGYRVKEPVDCESPVFKSEYKIWPEYGSKIVEYIEGLCAKLVVPLQDIDVLSEMRIFLRKYIHEIYYAKLPRWPPVGGANNVLFHVDVANSYTYGDSYVVWSCYGMMSAQDSTKLMDDRRVFIAKFFGDPEIKLLMINRHKMTELETLYQTNGIEACKKVIDEKALALRHG